jgi:hypothetical protein
MDMGIQEELADVTMSQLSETMHASISAGATGSEERGGFPAYLRANYPEIFDFIAESANEMEFPSEEAFIYFRFGATFAAAAICRNVDSRALPSVD